MYISKTIYFNNFIDIHFIIPLINEYTIIYSAVFFGESVNRH